MSVTAKDLGIDRLDVDSRMALVEEIWLGLFEDLEQSPLTQEQRAELDRRIAHHEANPESGVPLDAVMARVKQRLHG
ncbi:MAG: addiction module protein [Burkholderiaceae bacterium]